MKEENNNKLIKAEQTHQLSTQKRFLTAYSPINCIKLLKEVTTVKKSLTAGTPSIAKMVKEFGEEKVEDYVRLWLISLNESLNLKRPLKPHQIDECAIRIVSKYRHVTISDINLIFNRAKEGYYGEFYESISIPKILTWFKDYFDERCEVAASISQMEHERIKYNSEKVKRVGEDKEREMHEKAKEYYINKMKQDYDNSKKQD